MDAIKFSSFRLLVSSSLGLLPGALGARGPSWGTLSCAMAFGSPRPARPGSLPTGVLMLSVGLLFRLSGSEEKMKHMKTSKETERSSLVAQGLRPRAPKAGGSRSIPGQGTRSHMLQLRPSVRRQISKCFFFKKKRESRCGMRWEKRGQRRRWKGRSAEKEKQASFSAPTAEYLLHKDMH